MTGSFFVLLYGFTLFEIQFEVFLGVSFITVNKKYLVGVEKLR